VEPRLSPRDGRGGDSSAPQGAIAYLAGELGPTRYLTMVTKPKDSDERYYLFLRDTIPLEDERGFIPIPGLRNGGWPDW
jgi:hypothetical protein